MTVTGQVMLRLQVNFKSGLPVYLQLVEQIKAAAASGTLQHGEPLPSIRPLAEELRVNRNTIAKAYAELESLGVIETIPGKGCFLKQNTSPFRAKVRAEMLAEPIDALIVQAHHLQISEANLLRLVKERLVEFEAQRQKADAKSKEKAA